MDLKLQFLFLFYFDRALSKNQLYTFEDDFSFGVATSAYQTEGAWNEDGKGMSFWDYLTHNTDIIVDNSTGDVACNSYRMVETDIALLKTLGVRHYRFSIAWTRIFPDGFPNQINWDGVRFYDDLITKLVENHIEPWVTISHFDHPYPVELLGGWYQETIADYLADYADFLFKTYGNRVKTWITVNEPYSICVNGLPLKGNSIPSGVAEYICGYNVIKAHAAVWKRYQKYKPQQNGKLSMAFSLQAYLPASDSVEDREAAERANQFSFGWFVHPLVYGNYPEVMIDIIQRYSLAQGFTTSRLPRFDIEDLISITGTYDYIGLNNYDTYLVSANNDTIDAQPSYFNDMGVKILNNSDWNTTYSIQMRAKGLGIILKWIKENYNGPEIKITEQGTPDTTGTVLDYDRHNYLVENLQQLWKSITEDGVNVTGYTVWSFLDNFEWNKGYTVKYGLNAVNFDDPLRIRVPKLSSLTYRNVLKRKNLQGVHKIY
ncbi:myrosinase 1-like [Diorhabda carinulata]|uniref:myrosinase 1-like n=1 Tax=Diorhabda carinulata TaxID=1163345 RepID=UPI0025A20B11|nr:myrosinase 1-like [Diorhabda carinulata]